MSLKCVANVIDKKSVFPIEVKWKKSQGCHVLHKAVQVVNTPPSPNLGIMVKNEKFGFRTPQKMLRFPYFRGREGVKNNRKISYFFFLIRGGGGRGSKQIRTFTLFILFFLEGFPKEVNLYTKVFHDWPKLCQFLQFCWSIQSSCSIMIPNQGHKHGN